MPTAQIQQQCEAEPPRRRPPTADAAAAPSRHDWLGIEIRHLLALDAIARGRSFSAAADRLGYVQSAVSHQLAYLERLVGTRLVERERGPKPVSLTHAGELLLGHARDLLDGFAAAREELDAQSSGQLGTLRLGVLADISPALVGTLLGRLRAELPRVALTVWEAAHDETLLGRLGEGAVDLALTELPLADGPFHALALAVEPYVLVAAARSDDGGDPRELLRRMPLIAVGGERAQARVGSRLREHGLDPTSELHAERASIAMSLAAAGLGVAVLPASAIDRGDRELAVHELPGLLPMRLTGLAWHESRDDAPIVSAAREQAHGLLG